MAKDQNWNDDDGQARSPWEGDRSDQLPNGNEFPTEALPPQQQWHDPQWTSSTGTQGYGAWQGQAGQFYDQNQQYLYTQQPGYAHDNAHSWQPGSYLPGDGPPPKPAYKQWWFWTIIGILVVGIIALIIALWPGGGDEPETTAPSPTNPAEPSEPNNEAPGVDPQTDPAEDQDTEDMELGDGGGTNDEALADAQDRIDSGYSYWGPDDMTSLLEIEGYDSDAIDYALEQLDVDWDEQATGAAQQLVDSEYNGYSESGIEQYLEYSGFESEHINNALSDINVDYNEQALAALESYQERFDDSTEDDVRDYMESSGFSAEQIDDAFEATGN